MCTPLSATATYLWSTGAITNCINVNTAGTYSVTVTETGGCSSVCSKIITLNQPPICTITGNSSICNGQSIQLCTPLSATATYLWSTGARTNCINVNTAGTYSVTVTETGGCSSVCSKIITLNQPPICTITGNNVICQGQSTQLCVPLSATATYLWSNGATTNCINVSAAGTYSVTVTEGVGCSSVCSKTVIVSPLPSCDITGNCNICIGQSSQICAPSGFTSYLWNTGATTSCITVNTAGNYSVTVTNASGCSSVCNRDVVVNQTPICTITGRDSICQGDTTQLCVPTGALGYLWTTGATTNCITVNATGYYCVTITNSSGCTSICSKTVTLLTAITITSTVVQPACLTLGSITVTPNGGRLPYRYLWSSGQTTATISNLTGGTYSVTVTDANGCTAVRSFILQQTTITVTLTGSNTCTVSGSVTATASGGTLPYRYLWSSGQTTATISNLAIGTYTVTVTDANGCVAVKSITISALNNLICSIRQTVAIDCFGSSSGEAVVTVTGGTAPYTYRWQNGSTLATAVFLRSGLNSVTVTDANGCTTTCSIILVDPVCTPLTGAGTISGNQTFCNASELTGIFEVTPATGGSGIIEYLWMYSDFSDDFSAGGWHIVPNATGKDLPANLLPTIVRKTNFIRCVRRAGCCEYIEGNIITKLPTTINTYIGDRFPCLNVSRTYTAADNGAGTFYQWLFEGANISASNNRIATVTFTSTGVKTLTLIVAKNGCVQTRTMQITVTNCLSGFGNFMAFTASVATNKTNNRKEIALNWATNEEKEASKYLIERSSDNVNFALIGTIASINTANNLYAFMDEHPKMGQSFYRIRQLSTIDAPIFTSKTEKILLIEAGKSVIAYPNPVGSTVFVELLDSDNTEGGVLELYNALGALQKTQNFTTNQTRFEWDLSAFAQGNYLIRVRRESGKTATAKINKL